MKKRLPYVIWFLFWLAVEVFIALFVHDKIIRPYVGDVIVVIPIYCLFQAVSGKKFNSYSVAVGIFIFACIVELLQKIKIVEILGLQDIAFFRVIIGTSFAVEDIFCYAIGTAVIILGIFLYQKRSGKNEKS